MRSLPCPSRPIPVEVLDRLAHSLAQSAHLSPEATPAVIRARGLAGRAEIASRRLPPGSHPAGDLLGSLLPPQWYAAGLVVAARARRLEDPGHARPSEVTVAVLATRDGHVAHAVEGLAIDPADAPVGRLVDLLRRTMQLPTPAPAAPLSEWWRLRWLDRVVQHAAVAANLSDGSAIVTAAVEPDLVTALRRRPELLGVEGWEVLRRVAARAIDPTDPYDQALHRAATSVVSPRHAGWMDAGAFSRWALGELPSIDDLRLMAGALLPDHLLEPIEAVLGPPQRGAPAPSL